MSYRQIVTGWCIGWIYATVHWNLLKKKNLIWLHHSYAFTGALPIQAIFLAKFEYVTDQRFGSKVLFLATLLNINNLQIELRSFVKE